MDTPSSPIVWVLIISGITTGSLLVVVALVFGWHQKRLAQEAARWGQHLLSVQDEERHRIARDLHDDLVSQVYITRLAIERGAVAEATTQLGQIAHAIREIAHELHPPALTFFELPAALEEMARRHRSPIGPEIQVDSRLHHSVPEPMAITLFRVAQEGLSNALRHADASSIIISLHSGGGALQLCVEDNGRGLPEGVHDGTSFGIRSMRERLAAVGGTLRLGKRGPSGARLVAEVPLA